MSILFFLNSVVDFFSELGLGLFIWTTLPKKKTFRVQSSEIGAIQFGKKETQCVSYLLFALCAELQMQPKLFVSSHSFVPTP